MTTENKIWHTTNEKPEPDRRIIVHWTDNLDPKPQYDIEVTNEFWQGFCYKTIRWAYVSDLVACSKAVEVAIDTLENMSGSRPSTWNSADASDALDEIDEIMEENEEW